MTPVIILTEAFCLSCNRSTAAVIYIHEFGIVETACLNPKCCGHYHERVRETNQ